MHRKLWRNKKSMWQYVASFSSFYVFCFIIVRFLPEKSVYGRTALADPLVWMLYLGIEGVLAMRQRHKMSCLLKIGFVFSFVAAQLIGYLWIRGTMLRFDDTGGIFFAGICCFLTAFLVIVFRERKRKTFQRRELCFAVLILLIDLVAGLCWLGTFRRHVGAERGYVAGYETGQEDASENRVSYDVRDRVEKALQEGFRDGSAEWSGFMQYYSEGYEAGQASWKVECEYGN